MNPIHNHGHYSPVYQKKSIQPRTFYVLNHSNYTAENAKGDAGVDARIPSAWFCTAIFCLDNNSEKMAKALHLEFLEFIRYHLLVK